MHDDIRSAVRGLASQATSRNAVISDKMLLEKAQALGANSKLDVGTFKASAGWLYNFKKRKGIKLRQLSGESGSGESGSVDKDNVELAREAVSQLIQEGDYAASDVYSMDETALYWRAKPSKTLAAGDAHASCIMACMR